VRTRKKATFYRRKKNNTNINYHTLTIKELFIIQKENNIDNNGFIFIMNGFNNDNIIFHIAQENIENPLTISSKINRSNTYTNVQEELEIENVIKDKNISIYFF